MKSQCYGIAASTSPELGICVGVDARLESHISRGGRDYNIPEIIGCRIKAPGTKSLLLHQIIC